MNSDDHDDQTWDDVHERTLATLTAVGRPEWLEQLSLYVLVSSEPGGELLPGMCFRALFRDEDEGVRLSRVMVCVSVSSSCVRYKNMGPAHRCYTLDCEQTDVLLFRRLTADECMLLSCATALSQL